MKSDDHADRSVLTNHWLNKDDSVIAYRGNPLIGALGPIPTQAGAKKLLTQSPPYDPGEKNMPAHLRAHAMCALQQLFIPLPMHEDVVHEVGILLRQGYVHRNPLSPTYQRNVRKDRELLRQHTFPEERFRRSLQLGSKVVGGIGTGKTLSVEIASSILPSIVHHCYEVNGVRTALTQVPVLKLNVFQDASLKALGEEFFQRLGEVVGEPLDEQWNIYRLNGNSIQFAMYEAAQEYNLGLLVVDEMQNIVAHGKGFKAVLRYFTRMMNCIGLPVLIIGSNAAISLLKEDECTARRFLGRIRQFSPLTKGKLWHAFYSGVCRYLYVRSSTDLEKLEELVLGLTGGIPDFVIKLFTLAQYRVLGRKSEDITTKVINETAAQLFATVRHRILELKSAAPEGPGLNKVREELENEFVEQIKQDAERVGAGSVEVKGDHASTERATSVSGTRSVGSGDLSCHRNPIISAAASHDPIASLRQRNLLAPRP